jgi:ABC-type multidrug transport system permease subunit
MVDMRKYLRALAYAFKQQWKRTFTLYDMFFPILTALAPAIGAGYVVGKSGNPVAVSYVFVGVALMSLWTLGIFYIGYTLADEHWEGTLDLLMTTRTPVVLIVFAKALAILVWQMPAAVVSFLVVFALARSPANIAEPGLVFASGLLAIGAVVAFSFIFAPLGFLMGIRGTYSGLMPLGAAISGFLYPIGLLPGALEAVARCIPSAWAMEAVVRSVNGTDSFGRLAVDWAAAMGLIALYLVASVWLFARAEDRVRRSGDLGRI